MEEEKSCERLRKKLKDDSQDPCMDKRVYGIAKWDEERQV